MEICVLLFPDAIASWNLFMEIFNSKFVPFLRLLKNDIIFLIRPESKRCFIIHGPTGLRYIFQLRVRLSPLKGHKYWHKFIDTLSCTCQCNQGIEDTRLFLLSTPFYTTQRVTLATSVKEILLKVNLIHLEDQLKLYLHGDTSINNADNKTILLPVYNKIHKGNPAFLNLDIAPPRPHSLPPPPPLYLSDINVIIFYLYVWVFCFIRFFVFIRVIVVVF